MRLGQSCFPAQRGVRIALRDFLGDPARFLVNQAVGGENHWSAEAVPLAGEVGDFAAGLFDHEHTGGDIPAVEAKFPEGFEAASGDAGEIEGGGAVTADSVGTESEIPIVMNIRAGHALVRGEAGAQQARGKRVDFGDVDRLAVQPGAFAVGCGEQFIVDRVKDYAGEDGVALGERDRDAEARITMREIGGAVERIDVPSKFGVSFVASALFGGDGVIREIFGEPLDDGALGALVGLSDQIGVPFVDDVWRAIELLAENLAGFLGDFDGGFKIGLGHGV